MSEEVSSACYAALEPFPLSSGLPLLSSGVSPGIFHNSMRGCSGKESETGTVFVSPQVYPIVDFPLQDISLASQRGIEEHSTMLASRARILQQVRREKMRIRAWLGDASLLTQIEETGGFTLRSEGAGIKGLR